MPTTPNPTSGFMLIIPDKDLIKLNMNIEQGMKLVISGGIITPQAKDNLLKKAIQQILDQRHPFF